MKGFGRKVEVALLSGGMLLGGVALGATVFTSAPAGAEGQPTPPPLPPQIQEQMGPLFGVVHGELQLTRYDGTQLSLVYDRGMIVSKSDSEITLVRFDGEHVTVRIDDQTFVRQGLAPSSLDALQVGDRAMFFSEPTDGDALHAVLIRCITFLPRPVGGTPPGEPTQ